MVEKDAVDVEVVVDVVEVLMGSAITVDAEGISFVTIGRTGG